MFLFRIAATAVGGVFLGLAPASAASINPAGPQTITLHSSIEPIDYRRHSDEAIIGGIVSGVIGNAIGGSCYYNDCSYGDGYYGAGRYSGDRGYRGERSRGGHVGRGERDKR